ncbi:MAG: hypothetical protein V1880_00330 [Patescibacteria group bacterium]
MKKHPAAPRPVNVWIKAHTPFLKLLVILIGFGIIANFVVSIYSGITRIRGDCEFYRQQSENMALGTLHKALDYFAENPGEMEKFLPDGVNIPESLSITMQKVSDAGTPRDTWHLIGRLEAGNGQMYRLERCFAAPGEPNNK